MRDDFDIEDILREYSSSPSPRVKKAVMAGFDQRIEGKDSRGRVVGFWKKPIPLYMVAASLVIFMGLSYFAGKRAFRPGNRPMTSKDSTQKQISIEARDISWRITQRDLL